MRTMEIVLVTRPKVAGRRRGVIALLRATAKSGKALRVRSRLTGSYIAPLRQEHLSVRQIHRGKFYYAWCENGTRATKKGAR